MKVLVQEYNCHNVIAYVPFTWKSVVKFNVKKLSVELIKHQSIYSHLLLSISFCER